ncbi:MAG: SCO family protein [Salinibacter sp.]
MRAPLLRTGVVLLLSISALFLTACAGDGPDAGSETADNDLSLDVDTVLTDTTYTLRNQDSATVAVPDSFLGTPVVLGSIYTSCPNICPQITANMKAIQDSLDDPEAVQFVSVTFDPRRDTPSRLKDYQAQHDLSDTSWQFLTGTPETLDALLDRLGVRRRIEGTDREFPAADSTDYIFKHSNQITLIDAQGRVRAEYGGSQTPPSLIVRDLEKIQS